MLRHIAGGGHVLMTQDVFLKNKDNVFNETLPLLYSQALGCSDGFLDHHAAGEHGLVYEGQRREARVVVISARAGADDWRHWVRELLG